MSVQYFRVSISSAVRLTLLRPVDMGSLTCAHIWVRAVHTKEGQAHYKSAQESGTVKREDRGTEKLPFTLPRQGIEPGSSDLNSDALTTELRPPFNSFQFVDKSMGPCFQTFQFRMFYFTVLNLLAKQCQTNSVASSL